MASRSTPNNAAAGAEDVRYAREDIHFNSRDSYCAAWLYVPVGVERPPVVVLGHGVGATREMRLDAYCERFANAGLAALAFTYRNFGDSGGEPRQLLSVRGQLEDWESALAYAKSRDDLDGARMAVWGTSFGGGHAITIASRHPELRAAVSQCPFTDGVAIARALGPIASMRPVPYILRDLVARAFKRKPVMMPIAASPGTRALMDAPDALPGYQAIVPPGVDWVNRMPARAIPDILAYRPGRAAKRVRSPILFCISTTDTVAPASAAQEYARSAPKGEVINHDAGHFAFYLGKPFEELVERQIMFLAKHLSAAPAAAGPSTG
jgi:pimeloyl-ACP methyl ester carboxylesterase